MTDRFAWEPVEREEPREVWYRVTDRRTTRGADLWVQKFPVVRHTAKGVWLDEYGLEKFVLKDARKRFAYPTLAEAWESFFARKRRQLSILRAQAEHVEDALRVAERIKERAVAGVLS